MTKCPSIIQAPNALNDLEPPWCIYAQFIIPRRYPDPRKEEKTLPGPQEPFGALIFLGAREKRPIRLKNAWRAFSVAATHNLEGRVSSLPALTIREVFFSNCDCVDTPE